MVHEKGEGEGEGEGEEEEEEERLCSKAKSDCGQKKRSKIAEGGGEILGCQKKWIP